MEIEVNFVLATVFNFEIILAVTAIAIRKKEKS